MDAAITSTYRRDEKEEGAKKESHFVREYGERVQTNIQSLSMESRLVFKKA